MSKILLVFTLLSICVITGCKKQNVEMPAPSELYAMLSEALVLPEMAELPEDLFPDYYGIELEWFESAVSYSSIDIMMPDEIIIVKAINQAAADSIQERLKVRLAYKEKSAANYFAETIPNIKNGVIRQDGLTVTLIVTGDIDGAVSLLDSKSKK